MKKKKIFSVFFSTILFAVPCEFHTASGGVVWSDVCVCVGGGGVQERQRSHPHIFSQ